MGDPGLGNYFENKMYLRGFLWLVELFIIYTLLWDLYICPLSLSSELVFDYIVFEWAIEELIPPIVSNYCKPWEST